MAGKTRLLVAGIAAIVAVALAPHARQLWNEWRLRDDEAQRRLYIELKGREIACLERLASSLPKVAGVEAEIERCRRLAIDPATGEIVKEPSAP